MMDKINGYALLIVASRITKATVWHYSTGNDMGVCGADSGPNAIGYTDTKTAATLKGCCLACSRYVGKHGDYQGWDSENEVRFLSITNPKPEPVAEAFCAMHGEFISQCADQHNNDNDSGFRETTNAERTEGVQRIMAKVNSKGGFPVATPQETEMHFIGSGAIGEYWWWFDISLSYPVVGGIGEVPDDWSITGKFGEDDDYATFTLDHKSILRAIRAIAKLDPLADIRDRKYVSSSVVRECRTWVFKGPDECDFDAAMADEVMQYVVSQSVTY